MEIELAGNEYRIEKLDAFQQFHVSRKIAPLLPPMVPAMGALDSKLGIEHLAGLLSPLMEEFANMPDDKAEYVVNTCLSVVRRRQGDKWMPVFVNGALMFHDIDLGLMMRLTYRVVLDSLGPFIQGLLSESGLQMEKEEAPGS